MRSHDKGSEQKNINWIKKKKKNLKNFKQPGIYG